MTELQKQLFELQDKKYKDFHSSLMPTVEPDRIIGVRTPELKKFGKNFIKTGDVKTFLESLPHVYYEENNLHGFIVSQCKDFEQAIDLMEKFLPYIDNWATCDMCNPKVFSKHLDKMLIYIKKWISSDNTYTIRFGINTLMRHYLDGAFKSEYLEMIATLRSEEYYVNMMIAWFFATALAKQYHDTVIYLEEKRLDKWTHNKSIQKAVESRRISPEQKTYLKTLKIK